MNETPLQAEPEQRRIPSPCFLFAGVAIVGAAASLFGWWADLPRLTDWTNSGISQMPNNSLALGLAGIGLLLLHAGHKRTASIFGCMAALIGGATLYQHLSGADLGIDRLFLVRQWGQGATTTPGRMGLPGSTALFFLGISIVLASRHCTRGYAMAGAVATGAIAMLSITGYLFGADLLFTVPRVTAISFPTSTMLLALAIALVTCCPECYPMRILGRDSAAACLIRRAVPGVLLLPLLLGALTLYGVRCRLFDTPFAVAVLVICLMGLLSLLLWWSAMAVERHEAALVENKQKLAGILGSITAGFLTVDKDWRVVFANEQVEQRSGIKQVDLIGRNLWELFPALVGTLAQSELQRAMAARCSTGYEVFHPSRRKWFSERAYPTPEGGIAIYSEDITEDKEAAERLRDSEERMQLAMSIAEAGTWDLDMTTGVNHWSDSHFMMLGYQPTPDRVATESMWKNAVVAEDLPLVIKEAGRASLARDMFCSEHRLQRADTSDIIWVKAAGRFFYDQSGQPVRFVGVFFNITAQKQSEEELTRLAGELRMADQRKDEFLATLAHELRNPLAPVLNSVEILKSLGDDGGQASRARSMIERQIGHMVRLIDDLLDIGRISQDKLELRKERVELGDIIRQVVEAARPSLEARRHQLIATVPEGPVPLEADPVRLCQVFGNLLMNACKYTPPGGHIELGIAVGEMNAVISIKDSGIGVPCEMLDVIFDLFMQVDRTLEQSQGGLGIGLTLVKRLVELHGGNIRASSEGQGKGSVFIVTLPLDREAPLPQLKDPVPGTAIAATSRRILVVDDNVDSAQSLGLLLEMDGHEVAVVHDGEGAVREAQRFRPDLVFLDLGMPGMDGFTTCRAIRDLQPEVQAAIIALTGWGMEEDRRRTVAAGFDGHLVKPVQPALLRALVVRGAADLTEDPSPVQR